MSLSGAKLLGHPKWQSKKWWVWAWDFGRFSKRIELISGFRTISCILFPACFAPNIGRVPTLKWLTMTMTMAIAMAMTMVMMMMMKKKSHIHCRLFIAFHTRLDIVPVLCEHNWCWFSRKHVVSQLWMVSGWWCQHLVEFLTGWFVQIHFHKRPKIH